MAWRQRQFELSASPAIAQPQHSVYYPLMNTQPVLTQLMAVIEDRKANPPAKSYTTSLFAGGVEKIGAKILEEAAELVEAAQTSDQGQQEREHLIYEAGDVLYHVFVLLGYRGIKLAEVESELARRFGISGLDEKAARPT